MNATYIKGPEKAQLHGCEPYEGFSCLFQFLREAQ